MKWVAHALDNLSAVLKSQNWKKSTLYIATELLLGSDEQLCIANLGLYTEKKTSKKIRNFGQLVTEGKPLENKNK